MNVKGAKDNDDHGVCAIRGFLSAYDNKLELIVGVYVYLCLIIIFLCHYVLTLKISRNHLVWSFF